MVQELQIQSTLARGGSGLLVMRLGSGLHQRQLPRDLQKLYRQQLRLVQREDTLLLQLFQILPAEFDEPGYVDALQPRDGSITRFRSGLDCSRLDQTFACTQRHDAMGHLPALALAQSLHHHQDDNGRRSLPASAQRPAAWPWPHVLLRWRL